MDAKPRKPYPSDLSDAPWALLESSWPPPDVSLPPRHEDDPGRLSRRSLGVASHGRGSDDIGYVRDEPRLSPEYDGPPGIVRIVDLRLHTLTEDPERDFVLNR